MKHRQAMAPFVRNPLGSLVLAVLCAAMAALFLLDVLPPGLKYGPWHRWIMAAACAGLAGCFARWAWKGWRT